MQTTKSHAKFTSGVTVLMIASITLMPTLAACGATGTLPSIYPTASSHATTPHPAPTETAFAIEPTLTEDWSYRWLKGIPCKPPCWEGITPGQTTAREAEDILRQSPFVDAVEVSTVSSRPQVGVIKWNWRDTGKEGGGALFEPGSLSNPIHLIHPYFPVSVQFRDLLETYGEPSHIIARSFVNPDDTIAYDLAILYLSHGMLFDAGHGSTKLSLTGMTSLSGPSFFVPTDEGLQSAYAWAQSRPEWLVPWQGMQDFDFYCRDEEGNHCP